MTYNFDEIKDRRNTNSLKWDVSENELPMWVADMDFETAPAVKAAVLKTAEHGIFGYSITTDEYFKAYADFFRERYGAPFTPDALVYVSGIVAAISSIVRRITNPGENVLIQAPVYNIFYNCILNNGRRVLSSDLVYKNGSYEIDFSDLEKKLAEPQTSLMILCNPHNPVGKIWDKKTLRKIAELCEKHNVTVVSDEIHSPLTLPGKKYTPFASVSKTADDISITCIAASKAFNIAGLQSSCLYIKNPSLRHKIYRGINNDEVGEPNIFAVSANVAALRDSREWLDELNAYLAENRRFAEKFIDDEIPALHAVSSEASYLLWVYISGVSDDSEKFCKNLRQATGLFVNDGAEYGTPGKTFIRINLATQRSRIKDGLERLKKFVNKK
jgi:cystathionine beta-lyase